MEKPDKSTKKFQKELNSGIVSLILMAILERAPEPLYGYQIAKSLEASGEDLPMMKQGALYPVLRSLEGSGLLSSRVEPSVSGPPRRYYEITPEGRSALGDWIKLWNHTKRIVKTVLDGGSHA